MQLSDWCVETITYHVSSEYSIRLAEPEEWGLYCSVIETLLASANTRQFDYLDFSEYNRVNSSNLWYSILW